MDRRKENSSPADGSLVEVGFRDSRCGSATGPVDRYGLHLVYSLRAPSRALAVEVAVGQRETRVRVSENSVQVLADKACQLKFNCVGIRRL